MISLFQEARTNNLLSTLNITGMNQSIENCLQQFCPVSNIPKTVFIPFYEIFILKPHFALKIAFSSHWHTILKHYAFSFPLPDAADLFIN